MRDQGVRPSGAMRTDAGTKPGDDGDHNAGPVPRDVPGDGRSPLWSGDPRLGGGLRATGGADPDPGPLSGGRGRAPGRGRPDGGALWPAGGPTPDDGPRFDAPVRPGGYVWWYLDAISDDGRHGLTLIAFIGSVFSPYYALSGWADPLNHCAMNVALYGPNDNRWAMTERRRSALDRTRSHLSIGPSTLVWDGDALTATIDEVTAPLPSRLRGTIRLYPDAIFDTPFELDAAGRHVWRPIAPRARVEVSMTEPGLSWSGNGYFDTNAGSEPLQDAFSTWNWSRATTS
jgi:carotenoid 1,2-hydratase